VEGFGEDPLALAKRSGTTPEAIRATLEKLDGVRY
jgi:hypothetical protein